MKTVHEVSKISGVSVRTLHHYDAIGLLKPTAITHSGYRQYDDDALRQLQTILFFRELKFPLKEIKRIMAHPDFEQQEALQQQIKLLQLQRDHLDRLISLAREQLSKGGKQMDFSAFDNKELAQYADEVKARWGHTTAYQESQQRTAKRSEQEERDTAAGMMAIFARFGEIRHVDPTSVQAQSLVEALQSYISKHYYPCTLEILGGLGEMYSGDERFRRNIDRSGGEGTAHFAAKAIAAYCQQVK